MLYIAYRGEAKVSTQKRTQLGTYQDMESKLEKHTHILGREKGKLSGHRKKGISRNTYLLERSEIRTG